MAEEEEEEVRPSGGFWGSARSTAADRRKNRTGRKTKPGFFAGTAGILVTITTPNFDNFIISSYLANSKKYL